MWILAFTIDDATVQWVIAGVASSLTVLGTLAWAGGRKFVVFIKPHIEGFFTSHKSLVDTMTKQVPVVTETLKKLGETQDRQCETLARHDELHEQHKQKLDKIWGRLSDTKDERKPQ